MSADDELTELQIKVAFQEEALEALDDALIRQTGRVERLEERLAELQSRYEWLLERIPSEPPGQELPPHY
jgi:SlyX protein